MDDDSEIRTPQAQSGKERLQVSEAGREVHAGLKFKANHHAHAQ